MAGSSTADPSARLTLEDRIQIGRQQARELPLEQLGDPPSRDGRPDIVATLQAVGKDRIAELLPLRHARMAHSPLALLRGSASGEKAAALASRVAQTYRDAIRELSEKPTVGVLYERMTAADIEALAEEADSAAPAKETEAAPMCRTIFGVWNTCCDTAPGRHLRSSDCP